MARNSVLWLPLALFAALNLVSADVQFTSPVAGAKIAGGTSIDIEWKDSGDSPSISDLTTYQLFLCAGGNDESSIVQLTELTPATGSTFAVTGNKAAGVIPLTAGASTPANAYFFRIISTASTGGTVTNYSPRFSLSGMTGAFPASVITAMAQVSGTDGPPTVNNAANNPANSAGGDFGVEYTMQTGLTRYAPMQPVPPTKITKKNATPLHPTSSVPIALSILPIPKQQTTITQSQTFSVHSVPNSASPAPMPSDDMAKFLARWKD